MRSRSGIKQVYVSRLRAQATTMREELLKLSKKPIRADVSLVTNSKGEIAFDLPKSVPAYLYVRPVFGERDWDCSCFVRVPTDELLQKGFLVLTPSAARKPKPSIQPKAKEILFVMRRTPLWWRILYPVEKG